MGTRAARLDDIRNRLEDDQLTLKTNLSQVEDVDIVDALIRSKAQETSYQATLQVAATNAGNPAAVSLTGTATAAAGSSGSSGGNANVGAGGCTLSGSRSVFDPLLLALGAFSAAVLGWRRWRERPLRRPA